MNKSSPLFFFSFLFLSLRPCGLPVLFVYYVKVQAVHYIRRQKYGKPTPDLESGLSSVSNEVVSMGVQLNGLERRIAALEAGTSNPQPVKTMEKIKPGSAGEGAVSSDS
ncbi:uncharacterized protein N7483_010589 [Penicillium malachiteum]|uniref:uncharacterized protein n=1 Tax=Penicillium malachiteum TaxID=1324776 RepID=UPI002546CA53|nr:uncharacterized protein N7483_010589 [Penicillium malachiteum]KAJ5713408.1 hypothetical protein N7483_010589 [Penicillium malachiteum]